MQIVINNCFGGFSLSYAGVMAYAKRAGLKLNAYVNAIRPDGVTDFNRMVPYDGKSDAFVIYYSKFKLGRNGKVPEKGYFSCREIPRNDPNLIAVVHGLGAKSFGRCARLNIITIPDGVDWEISEYDGNEHVAQKHQTWS